MLRPDVRVESLAEVTPHLLRALSVRDVLLDLDDTLVASDGDDVVAEAPRLVARLRESGMGVAILSNGTPERVTRVSELLGVPALSLAGKPFSWAFRRALALLPGARPPSTAMVGDQLFTDVLGAKLAGMVTVLVKPLSEGKLPHTRLARRLERMILEER